VIRSIGEFERDLRQRSVHHFADYQFAQIFSLQPRVQNLISKTVPMDLRFLKHRKLAECPASAWCAGVENGLSGRVTIRSRRVLPFLPLHPDSRPPAVSVTSAST